MTDLEDAKRKRIAELWCKAFGHDPETTDLATSSTEWGFWMSLLDDIPPSPPLNGPIVNLNGASRESLLKDHVEVIEAAETLHRKLRLAMPHGRDYQTAPAGVYDADRKEWERFARFTDVVVVTYRAIAERLATEAL